MPVARVTGIVAIKGLDIRKGIDTAVLGNATIAAARHALKRAGSLFGIPTNQAHRIVWHT